MTVQEKDNIIRLIESNDYNNQLLAIVLYDSLNKTEYAFPYFYQTEIIKWNGIKDGFDEENIEGQRKPFNKYVLLNYKFTVEVNNSGDHYEKDWFHNDAIFVNDNRIYMSAEWFKFKVEIEPMIAKIIQHDKDREG